MDGRSADAAPRHVVELVVSIIACVPVFILKDAALIVARAVPVVSDVLLGGGGTRLLRKLLLLIDLDEFRRFGCFLRGQR